MELIQLQSTETNELFAALAKAQAEMIVVDRGVSGHFGAFATINDMAKASREALTKYGLSVSFDTFINDGKKMLRATLGHSSGQWKASVMELMLQKQDMQGYGAAISYAMRYSYKTVVGLIVLDKDEVDSESPAEEPETKQPTNNTAPAKKTWQDNGSKPPMQGLATQPQIDTIVKILKSNKDYEQRLLKKYTLLSNMPRQFASDIIGATKEKRPLPAIEGESQVTMYDQVGTPVEGNPDFEEVDSDLPF